MEIPRGAYTTSDALRHDVLKALRDFLDRVGEHWWAEWVQIALEDGRFPESCPGSAPCSLDDLVIGADRVDRVPPHLLPWANAVLDCLRCLLRRLESERETGGRRTRMPRVLPTGDLASHCDECICDARDRARDDAVRMAVRRSVERACREGRFDALLVLGRLDEDVPEVAETARPAVRGGRSACLTHADSRP